MANFVYVSGRLTATPEVALSRNGKPYSRFSLAVNRAYKTEGGTSADFISCVAFGGVCKVLEKLVKGNFLGVQGSLTNNNFTKPDGQKVYGYTVTVQNVDLMPKSDGTASIDFSEHEKNGFSPLLDSDTGDTLDEFPPFQ